jgi:hypothetical protein
MFIHLCGVNRWQVRRRLFVVISVTCFSKIQGIQEFQLSDFKGSESKTVGRYDWCGSSNRRALNHVQRFESSNIQNSNIQIFKPTFTHSAASCATPISSSLSSSLSYVVLYYHYTKSCLIEYPIIIHSNIQCHYSNFVWYSIQIFQTYLDAFSRLMINPHIVITLLFPLLCCIILSLYKIMSDRVSFHYSFKYSMSLFKFCLI